MVKLLNESVLILNKHFLGIQVTSVQSAVCALVTGKARVIDQNYTQYNLQRWIDFTIENPHEIGYAGLIRSPSVILYAPQVIIEPTCEFNSPLIKNIRYSRGNILRRDNYTCQYCNKQFAKDALTMDHIIPKSRGGPGSWTNITTACKKCNSKKKDKLLSELGWTLHSTPIKPQWKSHIGAPFNATKRTYWEVFLR